MTSTKICHEKSWPDQLSGNSDTEEGSSVNPFDTASNSDDHTSANCLSRWYEKPVYDRYWKHYRYMQDWFNRHHTVVHRLDCLSISGNHEKWNPYMYSVMLSQWSKYYYDMYLRQCETFFGKNQESDNCNNDNGPHRTPSVIPQKCSLEGVFKKPHPVTKHKSRKRKDSQRQSSQKRRKRHSVSSCKSSTSQQNESSGSQDLFEMEITGEMLDFFVKSAQHKKEMAALKKKKKEEEKETGDYVPLAAAPSGGRRTTQAPTERPGVRRTAEMKLLYGDGAAMIHGMETAVQLTYDRHFDILQPKFWPNLPLNIKF